MKFLFSCSACYLTRSLHSTRNSTHVLSSISVGCIKSDGSSNYAWWELLCIHSKCYVCFSSYFVQRTLTCTKGGGPQVDEVPRLGGVTNLSIQSLFSSLLLSQESWGTSPRRAARSALPGNPLRWGKFSPCECRRWGGVMFSWAFIHYKTSWKADRTAKNVKFNAQYFGLTGLSFLRGYAKWNGFWAGPVGDVHKDTPVFSLAIDFFAPWARKAL